MVTPEVLAYTRAKQGAGFAKEDIKKELAVVGWDAPSIEEIFRTLEKEEKEKTAEQPKTNTIAQTPPIVSATSATSATSVAAGVESAAKTQPAQLPATEPHPSAPASAEALPARMPVTPTLRALTAIDAQLRAGVDKKTVQALLLGVGWDMPAIDEAFLAVEWGESLLRPNSAAQPLSLDARAPKLSVVDAALAQTSAMPTRRALIAIDVLLRDGASKGDIRTLLLGVGWDIRAIDEAFLAVEWRSDPTSGSGVAAQSSTKPEEPAKLAPPQEIPALRAQSLPSAPMSAVQVLPEEPKPIVPTVPAEAIVVDPAKPTAGISDKILGGIFGR